MADVELNGVVILGDEQWQQGCAFYDEGQREKAITTWREALRLNPEHANARYNIGVALSESGHTEAAIAEWRETVRRHPDFWQAHDWLGHTFWRRFRDHNKHSDLQASRDAYEQVLAMRPNDAALLQWFSFIEWKLGNRRAAVAALQRVIRADPSRLDAYERLYRWQFRLGQWREAWRTTNAMVEQMNYEDFKCPIDYRCLFVRLVVPVVVFASIVFVLRKVMDNNRT